MKTHLWDGPATTSKAPGADPGRRARNGRAASYLPVVHLLGAGIVLAAGGAGALAAGAGPEAGLVALGAGSATVLATAACAVAVRRRVARPFRELEELVVAVDAVEGTGVVSTPA